MKNIIKKVNDKIKNNDIDCLIFDLDGTLFDTKKANETSYDMAFKDVRIPFNKNKYKDVFGLRFDEMINKVCPEISTKKKKIIKELKAVYYQKNIDLVVPNNLLIAFLKKTKKNKSDILICLATTASRVNTELILRHFKIIKYFDYILCGEDTEKAKPHPECYIKCINKFSLYPKRIIIFEDSEVGLKAAQKSGANYIKVKL